MDSKTACQSSSDSHINSFIRFKLALTEDNPTLSLMMKPNGLNFRTVSYACKTCHENAERNSPGGQLFLKALPTNSLKELFIILSITGTIRLEKVLLYTPGIAIIILHILKI
jgi:hypothetical protein